MPGDLLMTGQPTRSPMESVFLTSLLLLGICCVLLLWIWKAKTIPGRLPPGPTPLPILGNFLQVGRKNVIQSLEKMSKKYGPVFTIYLGFRRVVVLCSYKVVKEALVDHGEEFSGRGQLPSFSKDFREYGVVFSNGERWKTLRRFSLTTLRNFGMGKRSLEERVHEEAHCLVEEFHKMQGMPFDPTAILSHAVANIICSIVFGNRFEYSDEKFLSLSDPLTERFRCATTPEAELYNFFPEIMGKIPGPHLKSSQCSQKIIHFIEERVKMHQATLDHHNLESFIDCFLAKMEQEKNHPGSEFHMDNLVMAVFNLFFAGTETISTTLRFAFLFLMKYPEVQAKIHEEIDQMIGPKRTPSSEDRSKMPYTEAVIQEVQRLADILPMSLPHAVTQDTYFRGFLIPKGTYVYPLLSTVHSDPEQHVRPEAFDPGRFLDSQGNLKKVDAFMPFSAGKRLCLGQGLAKMELFLFLTTILQSFTLTPLSPPDNISVAPAAVGIGKVPSRYQLSMMARQP